MYRLLCGLTALVIGLLVFAGYASMLSNDWYANYTDALLVKILSEVPSLHNWLVNADFIDMQLILTLIQASVLSVAFALLFSLSLALFSGMIRYVHFAIFGVFVGFLYFAVPALIDFIDSGVFGNSDVFNPAMMSPLIDVLVWYLPLVCAIFLTANIKRKQHARAERFWFR